MAGPPMRPDPESFDIEEETRSLTGIGANFSRRRRRLGGDSLFDTCIDWMIGAARTKGAVLLGVLALVAVYIFGKETGQRFSQPLTGIHDGAPRPPSMAAVPRTPTYQPTGTDPPVPTYDPTKAGTPPPTPLPTFGNDSFVPPPNPYVEKFNTTEWIEFNKVQWEKRTQNSILIKEKYGTYCPNEPLVPMCPALDGEQKIANKDWNALLKGPTTNCIQTGDRTARCGIDNPWLNKTIWPLIRGPFCAALNVERNNKFPMPEELVPYSELGYDRADPTKSTDGAPFDGGSPTEGSLLWFDPETVKDHFLKFEAMLEHYYEGLARPLLEAAIKPSPENPLYAPMLKAYADQIARALLRRKKNGVADDGIVIGVLGDSVTSGTDNCYYDAWPEQFRRQMAPIFGSMGVKLEIRNAAKNGGWLLQPQMLCANDMLAASDRSNDVGLDFLFQNNNFVKASSIDAEHLIRRALFGQSQTLISITTQNGMDADSFVKRYAQAGLTIGVENSYKLPEFGMPESGFTYWFPSADRAFWGMQGDGFCHLTTRSGSASVVKRNWHWGPLIHQTYADSYALLFSRATRLAIDDLSAGRVPPLPPRATNFDRIINETDVNQESTPTWQKLLVADMGLDDVVSEGISGVHCAVGPANQAGSTLLRHWLLPAEGSPFEEKMKTRNGVSFVPSDHLDEGSAFYRVSSPISPPNNAVDIGDWVPNPNAFGAEAPRTAEQCRHVDGSTMVNMANKPEISWLTWKVPEGAVSIGRVMICHPRSATTKLAEDSFDTKKVRFHYAVSDATGTWKVVEDAQKNDYRGNVCTVVVNDMDETEKTAARLYGMWVAVEWKQEGIFDFDYLVAM